MEFQKHMRKIIKAEKIKTSSFQKQKKRGYNDIVATAHTLHGASLVSLKIIFACG